jgi:hypothetical protein
MVFPTPTGLSRTGDISWRIKLSAPASPFQGEEVIAVYPPSIPAPRRCIKMHPSLVREDASCRPTVSWGEGLRRLRCRRTSTGCAVWPGRRRITDQPRGSRSTAALAGRTSQEAFCGGASISPLKRGRPRGCPCLEKDRRLFGAPQSSLFDMSRTHCAAATNGHACSRHPGESRGSRVARSELAASGFRISPE